MGDIHVRDIDICNSDGVTAARWNLKVGFDETIVSGDRPASIIDGNISSPARWNSECGGRTIGHCARTNVAADCRWRASIVGMRGGNGITMGVDDGKGQVLWWGGDLSSCHGCSWSSKSSSLGRAEDTLRDNTLAADDCSSWRWSWSWNSKCSGSKSYNCKNGEGLHIASGEDIVKIGLSAREREKDAVDEMKLILVDDENKSQEYLWLFIPFPGWWQTEVFRRADSIDGSKETYLCT